MEITLDAYAARSCPVKTFNKFDPTLAQASSDESIQDAFQGGREYRDHVTALLAGLPDVIDLRAGTDWARLEEGALAAMAEGAPVILGALLPLDLMGHRSGRADILVRGDDTPDGRPGYWPVRVKPYKVLEKQLGCTDLMTSSVAEPARREVLPDVRYRVFREPALLELAHVWRLLQTAGYASTTPWAGIVGRPTDAEAPDGSTPIVWVNLEHRFIRTYSRTATAGYKLRSPLERYDHEHGFRVYVAEHAMKRTGVDDPPPVVRPIRVRECENCQWWEVCRSRIDDDDLSIRISKTPLDVRELQTLMGLGITTVSELAAADIDAILPDYLPLTTHRNHTEARLRQAARRARMLEAGVALERFSVDPINVPRSPIEVDLDIETTDKGITYLWGALVTDTATGEQSFHHFSAFGEVDRAAEAELAAEFSRWLLGMVQQHRGLRVFHYSDYEPVHLRTIAARSNHPDVVAACELVGEHFVDLFTYIRDNFVGVNGLGLKAVATTGAGFHWRDEEPGGLNSQSWFQEAATAATPEARDAARRRVLEYNEDDVRATWAVREWLAEADRDAFS